MDSQDKGVLAFKRRYGLENKFVIMYSGNIGLYYDLENLIKVIKNFKPGTKSSDGREVVFAFVGEGTILDNLKSFANENGMSNVSFIPYQDKSDLIYSLNAGDVHWCVNAKGIKGVSCPSKFYGIAAVGKPIIGVLEEGSEVERLISEIGCGKVSEPGDYESIGQNLRWFINNMEDEKLTEMGNRGYDYLVKYLTKDVSVRKYLEAI